MSMNSNAVKRKYQKCVDRMKNMKKKPEFHGSDLEKIADYYHLNKENIILFGANVNPLGLSGQVKKDLAEHLDIISSYPDRDNQYSRCGSISQTPDKIFSPYHPALPLHELLQALLAGFFIGTLRGQTCKRVHILKFYNLFPQLLITHNLL